MKKRYLLLIGGFLGWVLAFSIYAYGNRVIRSAQEEFAAAIKSNAQTIVYKAQKSDSKIAVMWAEKEKIPWKDVITVRVGSPKEKNLRQIIFEKQ